VAVDSHSPTTLAIATANAILRNPEDGMNIATPETMGRQIGSREFILYLAADLHRILGDAMVMATTTVPSTHTSGSILCGPPNRWTASAMG
jgi:hypothetical protein